MQKELSQIKIYKCILTIGNIIFDPIRHYTLQQTKHNSNNPKNKKTKKKKQTQTTQKFLENSQCFQMFPNKMTKQKTSVHLLYILHTTHLGVVLLKS